MRPLLSSFLAAALLVGPATQTMAASQPCMRTTEKTAFDVAGLKSELMVIAIDCQAQDQYNAFVARFRPDLRGSERGLNAYFARTARGSREAAHDDYITSLANSLSEDALTRGTLFCNEHIKMFQDVLSLKDGRDLLTYASGKGLAQPISVIECPAPAPRVVKKSKRVASK